MAASKFYKSENTDCLGLSEGTQNVHRLEVDQKGRILLPQKVRDRLGLAPGSKVNVREEDGKIVVEPEEDPEKIIERMNKLVEEPSPPCGETFSIDDVDPIAQNHRKRIQQGVKQAEQTDE